MQCHITKAVLLLGLLILAVAQAHGGHDHDHGHHHHDHGHHHHDHDHDHHGHDHGHEEEEEIVADEKDVVVLTSENFEEVITKNAQVLVEFYAPWCGHCKHLIPVYADLATTLKAESSPIVIAKIDATAHADVADHYGVQGFPTIKFFRNGSPLDYQAGRTKEDFMTWLKKKSGPSTTLLTSQAEVDSFLAKEGTKLLAYVTKEQADVWESAASSGSLEDFAIGHVTESSLYQGSSAGTFTIHKPEEEVVKYTGAFDKDSIIAHVKAEGYPLIRLLDQDLWTLSQNTQHPLVAIFIDGETPDVSGYKAVATTFKSKVYFSFHPSAELAERWGASGAVLPTAIFVKWNEAEPKFVVFNEETTFNAENLEKFINGGIDGSYESYKKSEPIPEQNSDPVFVLVGKQFEEVVFDTKKDVFVEFYAPWCGHCKMLAPIWEELGATFANHKDKIVIAKMDATANSPHEKVFIEGFPTLIFYPANNKDGVNYEGERDLESMKAFVLEHANHKASLKAAIGVKEDL